MTLPTRRAVLAGLACARCRRAPGLSQAAYPNRPVRIVVPFAPGGGADIVSRLLQTHLQQTLGQPFVVENRAGAAGRIGTALVAKADADGHTLLTTTESSMVIAPHTGAVLGYDPIKDFAPVSLLTRNTVVLVVHPSVPAKTLKEYMALAKAQPGKLFYGSSGVGGPNHLAGESLQPDGWPQHRACAVSRHRRGAAGGDRQPGRRHVGIHRRAHSVHPRRQAARARGQQQRSARRRCRTCRPWPKPACPATRRRPGSDMLAPAGTPPASLDRLWNAVNAAMKVPTVRETLISGGTDIVVSKPDEFREVIASDLAKYAKLADMFKAAK